MPTLSLLSGKSLPPTDRVEDVHQDFVYDSRYEYEAYEVDPVRFARVSYPSYPIRAYELGDTFVVVEGEIYNRADRDVDAKIAALKERDFEVESVSAWLQKLDGEFVIYAVDTVSGDATVIPDLLGQLPLYYATTGNVGAVGRKKSALAALTGTTDVDRLAVAEYLRLGYTLTDRTFYDDIRRVPPGTVVHVDGTTGAVNPEQHYTFDFSATPHSSRDVGENARELASMFAEACARRAEACPGDNVLLLSGGLDSRGILAGFEAEDVRYRAITRDSDQENPVDVSVAEKLAASVDGNWTRMQTPRPTGNDLLCHLRMSGGTDPFNIARIQPFLRTVRADVPEGSWLYPGAGGDKVMPDLSPTRSLDSMEDLIDYVLSVECTFSADDVESITGVPESRIRDDLQSRLDSYPESNLEKKFVHYEIFERAFSWLFEATDTNRHHLWTSTPYYSLEVLHYSMGVPDRQKRRYRLFAEFLEHLSPALAGVENANFGAPPNSLSHAARVALYNRLQRHPAVFDAVKPALKAILGDRTGTDADPKLVECLRKQVEAEERGVIKPEGVSETVLSRASSYTSTELSQVFTLTSFLDQESETPALEQYRSEAFG